jgi:hypothetical protein
VTLKPGNSSFYCPSCGGTTDIVFARRNAEWKLNTAPAKRSAVREPQD